MTNEFYKRLHELEGLLQLHFSDIGDTYGFNVNLERSVMHEPISMWGDPQVMMAPINYRYGYRIRLELTIQPK
jgi:hypothetical protein